MTPVSFLEIRFMRQIIRVIEKYMEIKLLAEEEEPHRRFYN